MMTKIREGYKETEIGVIPEEWDVGTFENICVPKGMVRGPFGGALKKEFFVQSGYKVYEQKNAINKDASIGEYYINQEKFEELKRFEVKPKDFIVSCSGTIGKIYQIPENHEKGIINQALLKITTNPDIIYDLFFYNYFEWDNFQRKIIDNTQGGAMKNLVGMDIIKKTPFSIPPLPEQKRIAEILSTTDSHIEKLDKTIEDYQLLKKGMMKKLLTEGIGHTEFKETEIGRIPKAWVLSPIFNTGQYINGKAFKPTDWEDSGTPIIRIQNLSNREAECNYYNGVIEEKYIVNKDDILFSWSGTLGVYRWYGDKAYLNQHIYKVVPNQDIDANYLMFQLDYAIERMAELSHGSTMKHVTKKNLETFLVAIPSIEEQTRIATVLTVIDLRLNKFIQERKDYLLLKSSMMELLLTGKVRVNSFEV